MRNVCGAVVAASLFVTGAVAQPLSPGHPAGVKKARLSSSYEIEMLSAGAAIMTVVGILASRQSSTVNSQSFPGQPLVAPTTTG
jgi:hypothetical protein